MYEFDHFVRMATGSEANYRWLATKQHGISDLLSACPEIVSGKFLAITSWDSGPFDVQEDEHTGWTRTGDIAYSPCLHSLHTLPLTYGYDEWYVFPEPVSLGALVREKVFDSPITPRQVQVFVNFAGFALHLPEMQDLAARFWKQMEWIQPESYIAEGDQDSLLLVTREDRLFAEALHTLSSSEGIH